MTTITKYLLIVLSVLLVTSCEEYLDKSPESDLGVEEVFKDFQNAQGFVEEIYMFITDYSLGAHWETFFLLGDDASGRTPWLMDAYIDEGNLRYVSSKGNDWNFFVNSGDYNTTSGWAFERPGIWEGWDAIRKANIVIENIDFMVDASQVERDVILGQAYFFRAYFHSEIMKYWGRIPYIDEVLYNDYEYKRPDTYKECAMRADADYALAVQLLPENWDNSPVGSLTQGENKGRVTKGAAYALKGKNLLIAASPLMHGSKDTYDYDEELCKLAVDAFAEVLKLADNSVYALNSWDTYEEVFYSYNEGNKWPGGTEYIFNNPSSSGYLNGNLAGIFAFIDNVGGSNLMCPTHNFIQNNFGMSDGLSCDESPLFDPTKPFENRDPRLYKWVVLDGDPLVKNFGAARKAVDTTAQFFVDGAHHYTSTDQSTNTGYAIKKYHGITFNRWDGETRNSENYTPYTSWRLHMRLTDVYLMYAEAAAVKYGASGTPEAYSLTAEAAINILRDRASVPDVQYAGEDGFMDELRRDRAVELSFEGHRWLDIRRWSLAHLSKYKRKTRLNFDKDHTYFEEELIVERVCDYPKHFWMPFEQSQTEFFDGFEQNPGW